MGTFFYIHGIGVATLLTQVSYSRLNARQVSAARLVKPESAIPIVIEN